MGRAAVAKVQTRVRAELGKKGSRGSGHVAPIKPKSELASKKNTFEFDVQNEQSLYGDTTFKILGGGGDTPLGNYTLKPKNYGNAIVGVWNPPGSGSGGARFDGSGGIRAFLPVKNTKFQICDVAPMTIKDETGKGTSEWYYVTTRLNGESIYCWLLQSWKTPDGNVGQNFDRP
jgi:hypothetical protein